MLSIKTKISKWGNSQVVRLPKVILDSLLLRENDAVEISTIDDSIVIKKVGRKRRAKVSLEERFKDWNGEYVLSDEAKEWLNIKPVGNEAW